MKISVVFVLLFLISCNEEVQEPQKSYFEEYGYKKTIEPEYFNVKLINNFEVKRRLSSFPSLRAFFSLEKYYNGAINSGFHNTSYFVYTDHEKYHVFNNDSNTRYLEIQFPCYKYRRSMQLHCLIGHRKAKRQTRDPVYQRLYKNDLCFYIFWINKHYRNDPSMTGHDYSKNWVIDSTTDTVYTNINKRKFRSLFPNHSGEVIDGNIKEIIIKNNFSLDEPEFYNDIEFVGFDRLRKNSDYMKQNKIKTE